MIKLKEDNCKLLYEMEKDNEYVLKLSKMRKGKKEGINEAKIEIAKSLLKENINKELISKITNLSIEEINNL